MKKVLAPFIAVVVALGLGLAVATPAQALPTGCTSAWSAWYGPSWGLFRYCWAQEEDLKYWQFQIDDTLTDGYAVHLEACSDTPAYYPHTCSAVGGWFSPFWGLILADTANPPDTCIQSAGPVHSSQFPSAATKANGYAPAQSWFEVEIVRGRCEGGAYQNTASFAVMLEPPGVIQ